MSNIAVVGAGYAGMAVTWHLLQAKADVTVFENGKGASYASTGLLHPAPGKKALPSLYAKEGMESALELLQIASKERPVFEQSGILRYAINEEQRQLFGAASIFIPEGMAVYSRPYLEELKKVCKGARFVSQKIENLQELSSFDAVILTTGSETDQFIDLPMKRTIGQSLVCRWPERLGMSLLAGVHITPTEDPEFCQVGSTYEHTESPDPQKALALLDKVARFYPPAKEFKVVEIRSGVRVAPKEGYQPFVQKVGPKTWVFCGLGSRGLLYHSLFAKTLVLNEILPS